MWSWGLSAGKGIWVEISMTLLLKQTAAEAQVVNRDQGPGHKGSLFLSLGSLSPTAPPRARAVNLTQSILLCSCPSHPRPHCLWGQDPYFPYLH